MVTTRAPSLRADAMLLRPSIWLGYQTTSDIGTGSSGPTSSIVGCPLRWLA